MKAYASSIQENKKQFSAQNVLDKNPTTRWSSEFSNPQWIYIDAEKPVEFNIVEIDWETGFGEEYEIQISDNGADWRTVFKMEHGAGGTDTIYTGRQQARYVRMYGIKHGASWGFSIYRFKLQLRDDGRAPAGPKDLSAVARDKVVFLDWADNNEEDLKGYNIYRAEKEEGPYNKLNNEVLTLSHYKDKGLDNEKTYFYQVRALDYPGEASQPSKSISATPQADTSVRESAAGAFDIPACAWSRYLGDVPVDCFSSSPERGIALGGFGAGSFMYSISGSFGPWAMKVAGFDQMWLSGGAFHLYEKEAGGGQQVKCLATSKKLKPAWDKLKPGEGKYFALQPKGWLSCDSFKADVSSEFYSPIIAHNYKETSYPVAVFKWKLHNPTDKELELGLMFTWQQPPFEYQTRQGFKNTYQETDKAHALVMRASDKANTPETQDTEWCLATARDKDVAVSYADSWCADADGADVWEDFKKDGCLDNKALDKSYSGAALSVKVKLRPNEEKIIPFILSWDYPVCEFGEKPGEGTQWYKRYTLFFGKDGGNALKIAEDALLNYPDWEKKINEWMQPVIDHPDYPEWLKLTAFNELYYSQFGGCFYEGGLKTGHDAKYLNKRPDVSRHFVLECMMYRYCNTFDVRHYSSIIYAKLWPDIEKETLLSWADAVLNDDPEHQVPHDCGGPQGDPYFTWDAYGTNQKHWKDLHSKFIQQCWRYYHFYQDKEFLEYVWPACKATYGYMKKTDTDSDGLPNNSGSDNTYDAWGLWGTSLLCGGLWVGALLAMEKMAELTGDELADEVKELLPKARENLDKKLWHKKGGYYQIDTESKFPTAIMADGLNGQRYCEYCGLDNILPPDKIKSHLKEVFERNVKPLKDFNGDGIGDCGAINGIREDGGHIGSLEQAEEIWTGSSYFLSASMYHAGLKDEALKTAYGVYYITYEEESSAYWFNTPEAWHDGGAYPRPTTPEQYQRPRAVWELIFEIDDPYKK